MLRPDPEIPPGWLFVYGTLKKGEVAHHLIERFIARIVPATVRGTLYHLPYGYPVIVPENRGIVHGELFFIPNLSQIIELLDDYEDYNSENSAESLFIRVMVEAKGSDGRYYYAWTYAAGEKLKKVLQKRAIPVTGGVWTSQRFAPATKF